jgi:photosystem II stability/assembly factor-like uncharacterized protein
MLNFQNISFSQSGWVLQQTGINQPLNSLVILDSVTVISVGNNGTLLKTTNGGVNFNTQFVGTNNSLYGINFPTYFTGYIISNSGNALLKTTNRGVNWSLSQAPVFTDPSIFFVDANTGYVTTIGPIGSGTSYILKTTNGGINWLTSYDGAGYITSIYFVGVNTGFAGGTYINNQGLILKTTNSGANWILINSPLPSNSNINSMFFIDSSTGYIAGNYIMKTTSSGVNWEIEYASFAGSNLYSIFFIDINMGYAVGTNGIIVKTSNSGIVWNSQQNLVTNNTLRCIKFINTSTGYACGNNGTIIKTTTGGEPLGIRPISNEIPDKFELGQNYPFNPATKIQFQIPQTNQIKISIYNILGEEVGILVGEKLRPGTYEVEWNAHNYSSGIYLYRLSTDDYSETKKMILAK